MPAEFHFLRPAWLLALLPLAWLVLQALRDVRVASAWQRACDPELLRALLLPAARSSRVPRVLGVLAGVTAVLALAGPSWQRLPQAVFESGEARVIVLDLSRSMDAPDLRPSRLARARFAAAELLEQIPEGRFGLVVFAGSAFPVVPLTDDRNILRQLLPMLTPDLMPIPGGRIAGGIKAAGELLRNGGAQGGDVILLTDSEVDSAALAAAQALSAGGHQLWVLGVGTALGAPVPTSDGVLRDGAGAVVKPRLAEAPLRELARAGGGRFERLSEHGVSAREFAAERIDTARAGSAYTTDAWRDEGRWLVLLLAPLAALAFRRGGWAAASLALCLALPPRAEAFEWADLWLNENQQALRALEARDADSAAAQFEDRRWRAAAAYRAGAHDLAADLFGAGDSADDHYNRGNALARAGRLRDAIAAYDNALVLHPDMEDARHNRALLERLLASPESPALGAAGQPGSASGASGPSQGGTGGAQSGEQQAGEAGAAQQDGASTQAGAAGERRDGGSGGTRGSGSAAGDVGESGAASAGDGARPSAGGATAAGADTGEQRAGAGAPGEGAAQAARRGRGPVSEEGRVASDEWLRQVDDDPGGLLRRKFQRLQDWRSDPAGVEQPW